MSDGTKPIDDPFLVGYQPSELRIASEFLTTWLPFLTRDLCPLCATSLADRVRSLSPEASSDSKPANPDENLTPKGKEVQMASDNGNGDDDYDDNYDTNSLGSWKDGTDEISEPYQDASTSDVASKSPSVETSNSKMSWADMAQEDELEEEEELNKRLVSVNASAGDLRITKSTLPREKREHIRFMSVKRKKDFVSLERDKGKYVNVVEGLELHTGIFSAVEQKRIVDFVYDLEQKGRNGELKPRTFTAPRKWMKGKGRITIQFGCCYNYAVDKNGNPPGILQNEMVDPLPSLFKVIIRRLVRWHVLPPTCIPDSCIVNIYEEGDCIPPHIDNHDFVRPFCTVSFLSECNILFGTNLKIIDAGEFEGPLRIPLPVGSVLVLKGRVADVAKHCVPAVPTKRISITFRRMDESKRPVWYTPEPDLQDIQPLSYEEDNSYRSHSPRSEPRTRRQSTRRGDNLESGGPSERSYSHSENRDSTWRGRRSGSRWNRGRGRGNLGS
ncbi:PREDICTED: uncharacterized protein LOC101301905 [Fragaria vesca subsp. vesca]